MSQTSSDPLLAKVFAFYWTREVIEEAIGNWTGNRKVMDPVMLESLRGYAARVATKILGASPAYPDFSPQWKTNVSNKVVEILDLKAFVADQVPTIVDELRIKHGDKSQEFEGLWGYSLSKIAHDVGCVAYMVANNLDPQLITMSAEEGQEEMQRMADRLTRDAPDKLLIVDPSVDTPQDVLNEIALRTNPPDVSDVFKKK